MHNKIILLFCFGHYPVGPEFQSPVIASRLGQTVTAYGNVRRRGIRLWGTSEDYRDRRGIVRFYIKLLVNITDAVYLIVPRDSLKYATIFYTHTWQTGNLRILITKRVWFRCNSTFQHCSKQGACDSSTTSDCILSPQTFCCQGALNLIPSRTDKHCCNASLSSVTPSSLCATSWL